MMRYIKLLHLFLRYSLMHIMTYKQDFVIWSFVDIGWFALSIYFYQLLYANVDAIAGWSKPQVFLLQGIYFITTSFLWGIFWNNFRELPIKINQGTLDFELIKPIDAQFLLSFKHLDIDNFNSFILGIITIIYAYHLGGFQFHLNLLIVALIVLIFGLVLFYSCYFISICLAFWFDRIDNLPWLFPSVRDLMKVPEPFFQNSLRFLFVYILPVVLITSLPTQILFGVVSTKLLLLLVSSSIITFILGRSFFHIAIRQYSSASS